MGAIPTGYWLGKWFKGIDVRQQGSGNIGATNIARLLGKKYFVFVFLLDAGKAMMTMFVCDHWLLSGFVGTYKITALLLVATTLLVGNAYSCFIAFRGGKGVATSVGIIWYLYPPLLALLFCCSWLMIMAVVRRAFVASLGAVVLVCLLGPVVYVLSLVQMLFLVFIALWLVIRHQANLKKWWAGSDA